ncbi:MAG: hypothetical protein KJ749_04175, partial [Planctomycetes bacterium]|nr:hypothetical protein [Planctomycetota bacterium]
MLTRKASVVLSIIALAAVAGSLYAEDIIGIRNAPDPVSDYFLERAASGARLAGEYEYSGTSAPVRGWLETGTLWIPGTDGSIAAWGSASGGLCNVPAPNADFVAVAAGESRSLGLNARTVGECGDPATLIHNIQGSGMTSPEVGNVHVIEGVVVGDFQTYAHLGGFFVQEEDADVDADPMTSEGIFVYDGFPPAVDVNVRDVVRIEGTVDEFYECTRLNNITAVRVCNHGVASAATVTLPIPNLNNWESYEGMLINIPQVLYATDNYYQGRYGEVDLSVGDRLDTPTNVVEPGPPALALQDLNDRSRIQLDDGSTAQNPAPAPYMGSGNTLRVGD